MSSRNIAVLKGVYDALRREKRGPESFTQVLLRLLEQRGAVDDLAGTWGEASPDSDLRAVRGLRGLGKDDSR